MIIYVSESLNSKKNGGSSTSGYEFLQLLRINHKNVVVLTHDGLTTENPGELFYGHKILGQVDTINLKRTYGLHPLSAKRFAKKIFYSLKDIHKRGSIDLGKYRSTESKNNIVFINSWSSIFSSANLKNIDNFTKVCIVRGSPESFRWQSHEEDKDAVIAEAAKYLEMFDHLIFVSKNGLEAWGKIMSKKVNSYYLPNSINENEINKVKRTQKQNAQSELGFSKKALNVVVVGSVQMRKAQDLLLEIVPDITRAFPRVIFHIVGVISDTWGGDKIHDSIVGSVYSKYFIFHGHSNRQLLYMQASDLLLFTSRGEAFPRTVAEYMAMEKPIVAADVSGVNEMIQNDYNGLLFSPEKPSELVEKLQLLINNPELQNKLARNACSTYYDTFSKKVQIPTALKIFNIIRDRL
jgi:glycosyltransferase involved in cell wall biosynthesis